MVKIFPPFSPEQVENIQLYQSRSNKVPFSCPEHEDKVMQVTTDGLHCPESNCPYKQFWAFDFMAEGDFKLGPSSTVAVGTIEAKHGSPH